MGLKAIQAKYDAAQKELDNTLGTFVKHAQAINEKLKAWKGKSEALMKANDELMKLVSETHAAASALKTDGVVQLNDVKKLLLLASEHPREPHPIKPEEIAALERNPSGDAVFKAFVAQAKAINAKLADYKTKLAASLKASDDFNKNYGEALNGAHHLETHGIVQFDECKKLLIMACEHPHQPHPVKLNEIQALEQKVRSATLDPIMQEYLAKQKANFPKEIKPGMTFHNHNLGMVFEVTSLGRPDRKGVLMYNGKWLKGRLFKLGDGGVISTDLKAPNWTMLKP